jgi:hypothetical protein
MRTSTLLAVATAATVVVLASVGPSALAQGGPMGGPMMSSPPLMAAKAAPGKAAAAKKKGAARGFLPGKAGAKGPGRCGTHMYWKAGKCVDARTKGK